MPADGPGAAALGAQRRHRRHALDGRGDRRSPADGARARRLRHRRGGARGSRARGRSSSARYSAQASRRLRHRLESRAADERRRARRAAASAPPTSSASARCSSLTRAGLRRIAPAAVALARGRRAVGARGVDRRSGCGAFRERHGGELRIREASGRRRRDCGCTSTRTPPAARRPCSRRCARSTRQDVAAYPDYDAAVAACAARLRRRRRLAAADQRARRGHPRWPRSRVLRGSSAAPCEAIVVVPAFDMYAACADAVGGRDGRQCRSAADFAFPLAGVLDAITTATRLVFLTNPNNPTGQLDAARRDCSASRAAAPDALVFVDEAYADFCGETLIEDDALGRHCRTSSSAGRSPRRTAWPACASARWSALPETLAPMRRAVPPYSLNVVRGGGAAGGARRPRVLRLVRRAGRASRRRCSTTAASGAASRYWPSAANFVLACVRRRRGPGGRRAGGARRPRPRSIDATPGARAASASRPASSTTRDAASRRSRRSCAARA